MIEFDKPLTFPDIIRKWVINRKNYFLQEVYEKIMSQCLEFHNFYN